MTRTTRVRAHRRRKPSGGYTTVRQHTRRVNGGGVMNNLPRHKNTVISDEEKNLQEIVDVIKYEKAFLCGNDEDPKDIAREWAWRDFTADEVQEWVDSRCFEAEGADDLRSAGITPLQASKRTAEGVGGYNDTLGYKVANRDITAEEALSIIKEADS